MQDGFSKARDRLTCPFRRSSPSLVFGPVLLPLLSVMDDVARDAVSQELGERAFGEGMPPPLKPGLLGQDLWWRRRALKQSPGQRRLYCLLAFDSRPNTGS